MSAALATAPTASARDRERVRALWLGKRLGGAGPIGVRPRSPGVGNDAAARPQRRAAAVDVVEVEEEDEVSPTDSIDDDDCRSTWTSTRRS